jgi:repressor LexA
MEFLTSSQQELYDWLVDYIKEHQQSPSIRQMMRAMNLRSPATIFSRLEYLKNKGYIEWSEGKARTIRVRDDLRGIPILGTVAAGFVNEVFTETVERLDFRGLPIQAGDYALLVTGDSMIDAMIIQGDIVIMRPVKDVQGVQEGTIVAARVEGGTTLKSFHRQGDCVQLMPANSKYPLMEFPSEMVDVQGRLVAVWREIDLNLEEEDTTSEKNSE